MKQFYCYLYKVAGTYQYIGKGCDSRVFHHIKISEGTKKAKNGSYNEGFIGHLRNQKELGIEPEIEVIFCESEQEAHDIETTYIAEIGRICTGEGPLFNITLGGEGTSGIEPWNKGKQMSEKARANISAGHKGQKAWNKGVPMTDEAKAHLSAMNKGKTSTLEMRVKQSEAQKGRAPWNKGKQMSAETCAKKSASMKGKPKLMAFINSAGEIKKFRLGDIIPEGYDFKTKYNPMPEKIYTLTNPRISESIKIKH